MKKLIQNALKRMGYHVQGIRYLPHQLLQNEVTRKLEFDDAVCRYMFESGEGCTFIQVGAYDGVSTDPLRKYVERCGWKGVLMEPQPAPARSLRELYANVDGIVVMQAALDGKRGRRTLYTVDSKDVPKWVGGMASFDRKHIQNHDYLIPGIDRLINEIDVDCVTFEDVIHELPSNKVDILQIDAEGADGYILSLFPFDKFKPAIVQWEIKNMSRRQKEESLDILIGHKYQIAPSGGEDMIALRF
jgi:FkbM family methyltransferase